MPFTRFIVNGLSKQFVIFGMSTDPKPIQFTTTHICKHTVVDANADGI